MNTKKLLHLLLCLRCYLAQPYAELFRQAAHKSHGIYTHGDAAFADYAIKIGFSFKL